MGGFTAVTLGSAVYVFNKWRKAECKIKEPAEKLWGAISSEVIDDRDLRGFLKYADESGNMSRAKFIQALNELGVDDKHVIESFFDCFDKDGNGSVSFEEFVSGVAVIGSKTADPNRRLQFVFQSCDIAGDGVVRRPELRKIIHALLVTRENLWIADWDPTNRLSSHQTHKLKLENELQNKTRKAYASVGEGDNALSIYDIYNRARLRSNNEPSPYTSISIPDHDGISALPSAQEKAAVDRLRRARMQHLYAEFPFLSGLPLDDCLSSIADLITKHIFKDADRNNDDVLTFDEFEAWAKTGSKDARFLFSLFKGFRLANKPDRYYRNAMDLDMRFL